MVRVAVVTEDVLDGAQCAHSTPFVRIVGKQSSLVVKCIGYSGPADTCALSPSVVQYLGHPSDVGIEGLEETDVPCLHLVVIQTTNAVSQQWKQKLLGHVVRTQTLGSESAIVSTGAHPYGQVTPHTVVQCISDPWAHIPLLSALQEDTSPFLKRIHHAMRSISSVPTASFIAVQGQWRQSVQLIRAAIESSAAQLGYKAYSVVTLRFADVAQQHPKLPRTLETAKQIQPCVVLLPDLDLMYPVSGIPEALDHTPASTYTFLRSQLMHALDSSAWSRCIFIGGCSNLSRVHSIVAARLDAELDLPRSLAPRSTKALQVPDVPWSSIVGLKEAKQTLHECLVWPQQFPEALSAMGIRPSRGMLLHGPPGTGKSMLAKAVASKTGSVFINVDIADIVRSYVGESEKLVQSYFRQAREHAPSVLFFDEFQALFSSRSNAASGLGSGVTSQIMLELDRLPHDTPVLVLAATNILSQIDTALLRPGRFDHCIAVPLPDATARRALLAQLLASRPFSPPTAAALDSLTAATQGLSPAALAFRVNAAGLAWLRHSAPPVPIEALDPPL